MAKALFVGPDGALARKLAEIGYCNPFEETRWRLEKECLGSEYTEREPAILPGQSEELLAPNLTKLIGLSNRLIDSARRKLAKNASGWRPKELKVYEGLVHFFVFHHFMRRFDRLIHRSLQNKPPQERIDFYLDCRDMLRHYLNVADSIALEPEGEAHIFAFYFQLRRAWVNIYNFIVGGSPAINSLRARIWRSSFTQNFERYRRSLYNRMGDIVTLITGPSGTGKELIARAVAFSRFVPFDWRKAVFKVDFYQAFYPLNLSALSPTLIESELFGHRKGAYTGALQDRRGYFEDCGEYGTVFLDEVGETDPSIQVKLLRVLQTRQFQRLGDSKLLSFSGKVMAATNRDLPEEIAKGNFREDFYFRLCSDRIETPSLKEILRQDKNELNRFVFHISLQVAGPDDGEGLAEEASRWIKTNLGQAYEWPGNFRELEQCVRNILIHGQYSPESLGISRDQMERLGKAARQKLTANQLLSQYAQSLYGQCGSYEETAKILEVDRRTAKRYVMGVD